MTYQRDIVNADGSVLNVHIEGDQLRIGGYFWDVNNVKLNVHYPGTVQPAQVASSVQDGSITRITTVPCLFWDALHIPRGHPNVTCILEIHGTDCGLRFFNPGSTDAFAQTGGATYAIVSTVAPS